MRASVYDLHIKIGRAKFKALNANSALDSFRKWKIKGNGKNSDKTNLQERLAMIKAELDCEDTEKIEQHEPPYNWADAAIVTLEENFLTISSSVVHVYGQLGAEVGSGQFSIVRQSDGSTEPAMKIKVGRDLLWPITKDVLVCKLDNLRYLFSIVRPVEVEDDFLLWMNLSPSTEVLNYVVSFPKEEKESSSLEYLDTFLKQYARFNGSSSLDKISRLKVLD